MHLVFDQRNILLLFLAVAVRVASAENAPAATIMVATCNSSAYARRTALYVGDCAGDQQEINAAIRALPSVGGLVHLAEGTYDIRHVPKTLGGVIINRSNITLSGAGFATKLVLAADQNVNVIRIIGDGIENIIVRDLAIDGNWQNNSRDDPYTLPGVGKFKSRFEVCGIKASSSINRKNPVLAGDPTKLRNVTVYVPCPQFMYQPL